MFGIEKIWKEIKTMQMGYKILNAHCNSNSEVIGKLSDRVSSLQSTNDKRYNKLDKKVAEIDEVLSGNIQTPYLLADNLVTCDTCHCLLYKKDAIKGESRIVKKTGMSPMDSYIKQMIYGDDLPEKIEEVYFCNRCKGGDEKKEKRTNKSQGKVNKVSKRNNKAQG